MKRASAKESVSKLYGIAAGQAGFFTATEARAAGYRDNVHPYHVQNGDWLRLARGIYRLARFPDPDRPELMVALMWTRNRRGETEGVLSHMTALEVRGMVAPQPDAVHMTVPESFRRNSSPPKGVILHKGQAKEQDVETVGSLRVTSLIKTVADLQLNGHTKEFFEEIGADLALEGNGRPHPTPAARRPVGGGAPRRGPRPTRPKRTRMPKTAEKYDWDDEAPIVRRRPKPDDAWGGARAW